MRQAPPDLDLSEVRPISGILGTAVRLYLRYPTLFILLAALILVPYNLLILLFGSSDLVTGTSTAVGTYTLLALSTVVVVAPLISSLELQALVILGEGNHPHLGEVFRRALPVLLGVAAAQIIAGLLIVVGLFMLVIPGIYIAVRLAVVAQTAAFERTKWPTTLGRSWAMSQGNFFHVFGLVATVAILESLIATLIGDAFSSSPVAAQVVVAIVVGVLTQAFGALVLGLLYFDLRSREQ